MNFYSVDYLGKVKAISSGKADSLCNDRDFVIWYDDGDNTFIADSASDVKTIIIAIVFTIKEFKVKYFGLDDFEEELKFSLK